MVIVRQLLFDFINQIANLDSKEDYDYIILDNPRTLCLMYGVNDEVKRRRFYKKMFSFEKVDILSTDLKGKKVLIADFMMMRGIHTAKIHESIKKHEPSLIHTIVGEIQIERPQYYACKTDGIYEKNLFILHHRADYEYLNLMCKVSRFLYSINQPYVSNIYAFEIPKSEYMKFKEKSSDIEERYYEIDRCSNYMTNDEVKYFDCTSIKYNFITAAFIRIYLLSNSDNVLVIPQIELAPLSCEQVNNVWDKFNIPIQFNTIVDKYKAIKVILSYALYKKYFAYNSNETKWIDKSYIDDFVSIIDKTLDFSSIFEMVESVIGNIITPVKDNQNWSIMQKYLTTLKWNNMHEDMDKFLFSSYLSMEKDKYITRSNYSSLGTPDFDSDSVIRYLESITPLAMHELLNKIPSEKLSDFYAILLYYFDTDCIMPCTYVKDGFVETFLDIFYG